MRADSLFSRHKNFYLLIMIIPIISYFFLVLSFFLPLGYYNLGMSDFTKKSFTLFQIADLSGNNLSLLLFFFLFAIPPLVAQTSVFSSIRENKWRKNYKKIKTFCIIAYVCAFIGLIGYAVNLNVIENSTQYSLKFSSGSYCLFADVFLSIFVSSILLTVLHKIRKSEKSEDEVIDELFPGLPSTKK